MSGPGPWVAGTLVVSVLFGWAAPSLSRRVPPRSAVWLLSTGSVVVAAAALATPALVMTTVVGQWPVVAGLGQWSARILASRVPAQSPWAIAAALVVAVQAYRLARTLWTRGRRLVAAWAACRGASTGLVVIADSRPVVFTVPGWPGRVVASRGLLQRLDPSERRAVLAHEQNHLSARHDLHLLAGALAAAANPLLFRVPAALRLATERSADEWSAAETGDRRLVARAIGSAAGLCSPSSHPEAAMGVAGGDVSFRVRSLLSGPSRRRPLLQVSLVVLALAASAVVGLGMFDTKRLFELAEQAHALVALHR